MTLVNNHDSLGVKPKRQAIPQDQKLMIALKTNDLSKIRYTGKCHALGGDCVCGKKGILYCHFVLNENNEEFIVGSECIKYFTQSVQNQIGANDKQLRKAAEQRRKDEEQAYKENKAFDYCKPLKNQILELCKHPALQGQGILEYISRFNGSDNFDSKLLSSRITALKTQIQNLTKTA